jgi:hypothetical protein
VRELSLQGGSLSADVSVVEPDCHELRHKMEIEDYFPSQVFLWLKLMPSKSLVEGGDKHAKSNQGQSNITRVCKCLGLANFP